jgi:hypothetical protein
MPYYEYEPHSVSEDSQLYTVQYYDSYTITDRTVHNNRPQIVIFDITIKQADLIDAATPNSHNLHSTLTEKLHKCTDLKEELIRIWQLTTAYSTSTTGIIPNKLHESLKLLNFRAAI